LRYATIVVAIRPRSLLRLLWVPRSSIPWDQGLGTNAEQRTT
jgi:hypothetical protein